MTAAELVKWLRTAESKSVGADSGDGTRIGHHSAAHLVKILHKRPAHRCLEDMVQLGQRRIASDKHAPVDVRADTHQVNLELVDRH